MPPLRAIIWKGTPSSCSTHITAFADRHSNQSAPARNSASRAARCDGVHRPPFDFSSMVISLPQYKIQRSGAPALQPRNWRIRPVVGDAVVASVAVQ
jgi:hypothetical protein